MFQFIPYTIFVDHFAKNDEDRKTLRGLLGTHAILISILALLFFVGVQIDWQQGWLGNLDFSPDGQLPVVGGPKKILLVNQNSRVIVL